jgi:hypothetical protein
MPGEVEQVGAAVEPRGDLVPTAATQRIVNASQRRLRMWTS